MRVLSSIKKENVVLYFAVIILAIIGYQIYSHADSYKYLSDKHTLEIVKSKLWSLSWILISAIVIYWKRDKSYAPALAVFAVSAYFVILYGIMFSGTEYGMNGHWGDNGNRLALICKMMAYNSFFQDWYLKDLPSFYPPLWFFIMALYGKLLGIEAYQTIKFGYLFIFIFYPWLLFWAWKKVVRSAIAAAIVVGTIFFAYRYLDWIYYEHITAALFLPWWL
ncbi:MAG: arabinofuranosyltransferase, partial [FCB group bacterium]|nr:arabinofuranosyltransferase [FCB group bacterium]